jgi:hypothetical protein
MRCTGYWQQSMGLLPHDEHRVRESHAPREGLQSLLRRAPLTGRLSYEEDDEEAAEETAAAVEAPTVLDIVFYCTSCACVCVLYIVCMRLCTVLYIICMCPVLYIVCMRLCTVYCTSCARVLYCVLYIVCMRLCTVLCTVHRVHVSCTVLYIICTCGIDMFSTVADRHFSFQFCIFVFRYSFFVFHWPKNDPRNTLLFHKKCTITVTNRFPDSTYRQAQSSPSANNGMNTSLLAWCPANMSAESGVARAIGRREHSQG